MTIVGKTSYSDGYTLYNAEIGAIDNKMVVLIDRLARGTRKLEYCVVPIERVFNVSPGGVPVMSNAILRMWLEKHAAEQTYVDELQPLRDAKEKGDYGAFVRAFTNITGFDI